MFPWRPPHVGNEAECERESFPGRAALLASLSTMTVSTRLCGNSFCSQHGLRISVSVQVVGFGENRWAVSLRSALGARTQQGPGQDEYVLFIQ